MLEITRELIEHYLRATGWTFDPDGDGWWFGKDELGNTGRGFPASWLCATGLDIDVVARITGHSKRLASLAFRLGLCAAAEREREQMNAIHDRDTMSVSREERIRIDERSRSYQDLLTLAGIDPLSWESARKR